MSTVSYKSISWVAQLLFQIMMIYCSIGDQGSPKKFFKMMDMVWGKISELLRHNEQ